MDDAGSIQVVEASGSHYELGLAIGKQTKNSIAKVLLATRYVRKEESESMKAIVDRYLALVRRLYPGYVEEIEGMAKGAGVSFRTLFKYNVPDLIRLFKRQDENCTTLVLKSEGRVLIAHNEDAIDNSDIFLFKGMLPCGIRVMSVCYYGKLIGYSMTMNSKGLLVGNNSLTGLDEKFGVPKTFVLRHLITMQDIPQCRNYIDSETRSKAQNYLFYKDGEAVDVEASATESRAISIEGSFVHANNFVHPDLLKHEGKKNRDRGTFLRYPLAVKLMEKAKDVDDLLKILMSHENRPSSICSHGKEKGDLNRTLGTVVFDSRRPEELRVSYGFPCSSSLQTFRLDGLG